MVGMRDVAKKAGVSLSTVSLVVNDTGYVSDDMRARVTKAMRALNYIPNELARNLYHNRTNLVGVIVPTIRHPFFATLTAQLQHELAVQGLRTMLCSTSDAENGEAEYVDMLRRHMMDGLVMAAHTAHAADYWTSVHRPIVAFDRVLGAGIPSVGSDHEQGGRLVADLLIRSGARHVAMIGGPRNQFDDAAGLLGRSAAGGAADGLASTTFPTVRYYLTLERELARAGVRYEYVEAGEVADFDGYRRAIRDVFDRADGIDAVVSSDVGAAICVREALGRGVAIPRDVQVVAYDGTYLNDLTGMEPTSVVQDFRAIAQSITHRIVQTIAEESQGGMAVQQRNAANSTQPGTDVLVPVTLRVGATTRAAR